MGHTQERRTGTQDMSDKLVAERQDMWVAYCHLAGFEPYHEEQPTAEMVREFCQAMVDYIAAGHFSLYERIIEGKERRHGVVHLAEELYPPLANTTDVAMAFNDKYVDYKLDGPSEELSQDLSRIGESVAARIELEDRLLQAMLAPRDVGAGAKESSPA